MTHRCQEGALCLGGGYGFFPRRTCLRKEAGVIQRQRSQLSKPAQQVNLVCVETAVRLVVDSQADRSHHHLLRCKRYGGDGGEWQLGIRRHFMLPGAVIVDDHRFSRLPHLPDDAFVPFQARPDQVCVYTDANLLFEILTAGIDQENKTVRCAEELSCPADDRLEQLVQFQAADQTQGWSHAGLPGIHFAAAVLLQPVCGW